MRWTDERLALLRRSVVQDDGELHMTRAFKIYSSKKDAKETVKKLEEFGYVENIEPGLFRVKKLPNELSHLRDRIDSDHGMIKGLVKSMFRRFQS